jgi:murein DD-endopeptidase MepM/ murein hydrolase activator NlpD
VSSTAPATTVSRRRRDLSFSVDIRLRCISLILCGRRESNAIDAPSLPGSRRSASTEHAERSVAAPSVARLAHSAPPMTLRLVLAWLHLLALAVGLGGMWARARALDDSLRNPEDPRAIRRALVGNAWWGLAVVVWLATGLWRLVAGTERPPSYYVESNAFAVKMALLLVVVALDVWPNAVLLRWWRKRAEPGPRDVGRIEILSYVQCALIAGIVLAAVVTARSDGARRATPATPTDSASVSDSATAAGSSRDGADSLRDDPPAPVPSGTEVIAPADIDLLTREIAMPLDGIDPATLHSNFDERRGGGTRQHQALDIMSPRGTPVHAATAGRVLKLFHSVNGGNMVYAADSSERFVLMYAHLDRYQPGLTDSTRLARGQVIGYVGSTGNASPNAPHLHFAIARSADVKHWSRGKAIDPLPILQAR